MNIWKRLWDAGRRWFPGGSAAIPVPDGWTVDHKTEQSCYVYSPDETASLEVTLHRAELPDGPGNPCRELLETVTPANATIKDLGPRGAIAIYHSDPEDDGDVCHWQVVKQVSRAEVEILHYCLEIECEIEPQRRDELLRDVESCVRESQL
jgi:hypothetical protein